MNFTSGGQQYPYFRVRWSEDYEVEDSEGQRKQITGTKRLYNRRVFFEPHYDELVDGNTGDYAMKPLEDDGINANEANKKGPNVVQIKVEYYDSIVDFKYNNR